ncbi:zinc-dependent alcohol dehydrogenase [Streptosporangium sandarakinum]|uniref:zinc-dependent alcohol dehydrogenase n=1 Tax=Streptosporangium sandarakinum TaxID=1260955 RepID=UPI0033A907B3
MRQARLAGRRDIRLRDDAPVPEIGPHDVLIRVGACTMCNRSDLAYYHYHGLRDHCATGCFGHEIAGTVHAVGDRVTRTAPGRRVFVRTPLTSGYAEFAAAREIAVGALPDDIPFERGAILQTLPLAVHATRGVRLGDRVAIVGQGPIGLMALQVARLRGAAEIAVADLDPWRLERSALLGADRTVAVDASAGPDALLAALGGDFDVAVEAVGTPHTLAACMDLVRQNGLVVFLGTHHVDTHVTIDMVKWEKKGLRAHASAEPTDADRAAAMRVAERLVASLGDRLHLGDLLTGVYPLEDIQLAVDRLSASPTLYPAAEPGPHRTPPAETLKIAICPEPS